MRQEVSIKKYIWSFIITVAVFVVVFLISRNLDTQRISEVRSLGDKLSLDITSSETQFDLLKESSCKIVKYSGTFSDELNTLSEKIAYLEDNLSNTNADVIGLKKYYSLLEIKDFIVVNNIAKKCGTKPVIIIYFYSKTDCDDCKNFGYVMGKLREDYPEIHVYSFEYDLDLSAIKTMISIYGVKNTLPAIIIKDETYYGFKSIEDMEKLVPELSAIRALHENEKSSATSTSTN